MRVPAPQHSSADCLELGDGRRARLLEPLGRGASSTVFRAVLESGSGLERLVAVKLFGNVTSEEPEGTVERVTATARRMARVQHPNIVELHELGWRRMQPFFVTELVDGVSLETLLERYASTSRRLPLDVALYIACEAAEALAAARIARDHTGRQLGLLHLALGPRKVLLGFAGQVKVADFETSLATSGSSSVRSLRTVNHRTATMSPEVAMGDRGDARSDVFSLGVLMREIFVGPRFAKTISNPEAVRLAREGFLESVPFRPNLPNALTDLMERALALDPNERYASANALAYDLRRLALAMGVGDGRMPLRRVLDREFGTEAEVTAELLDRFEGTDEIDTPLAHDTLRPVACEDLADLDALTRLEALPTITTLDDADVVPSSSDGPP